MNSLKHTFSLAFGTLLVSLAFMVPVASALSSSTTFAVTSADCAKDGGKFHPKPDNPKDGTCCPKNAPELLTVDNNNSPDATACCPAGSTDGTSCITNKYLTPAVQLLSVIVGLAVTASIIIGAIQYASSAGDPAKSAAGQKRIRNSIFTLVAYLFLVAGLNFIVPGGL